MIKALRNFFENTKITKVAEKQLSQNLSTIRSLKDYDAGKKDISTADIERRVLGIRSTR